MIRLLFKSVVVVVLVVGIGNYLVYLKTGQMPLRDMRERMGDLRALFSPDELKNDAQKMVDGISNAYGEPKPAVPTKVYKWTDADGQVHFGDKPQNANAEQVEVKIQNAISDPDDTRAVVNDDSEGQQTTGESALDKARTAVEIMEQRIRKQEEELSQ